MVFQDQIAGGGQLGTVLLKTSQNGEIALVDNGTAKALNVGAHKPFVHLAYHCVGGQVVGRSHQWKPRSTTG